MKLLLTSSGIKNDSIETALVELVGKPKNEIRFAIINEAYAVEDGDKRWIIDEMSELSVRFGGPVDLVSLLALSSEQIKGRLEPADVIYVLGGNTDYQQDVFNRSGLTKLLPQLLENYVYVGSSAGSMVMGKRVGSEAYLQTYGEKGDYGVKQYLEYVDISIKPHLNSPDFPNNRVPKLQAMVDTSGDAGFLPLYAIDDQTAIQVVGNDVKIISEGEWKVFE